MLDSLSRGVFHTLAGSSTLKTLASRYGMRPRGFARRFIAGETLVDAITTAAPRFPSEASGDGGRRGIGSAGSQPA